MISENKFLQDIVKKSFQTTSQDYSVNLVNSTKITKKQADKIAKHHQKSIQNEIQDKKMVEKDNRIKVQKMSAYYSRVVNEIGEVDSELEAESTKKSQEQLGELVQSHI